MPRVLAQWAGGAPSLLTPEAPHSSDWEAPELTRFATGHPHGRHDAADPHRVRCGPALAAAPAAASAAGRPRGYHAAKAAAPADCCTERPDCGIHHGGGWQPALCTARALSFDYMPRLACRWGSTARAVCKLRFPTIRGHHAVFILGRLATAQKGRPLVTTGLLRAACLVPRGCDDAQAQDACAERDAVRMWGDAASAEAAMLRKRSADQEALLARYIYQCRSI